MLGLFVHSFAQYIHIHYHTNDMGNTYPRGKHVKIPTNTTQFQCFTQYIVQLKFVIFTVSLSFECCSLVISLMGKKPIRLSDPGIVEELVQRQSFFQSLWNSFFVSTRYKITKIQRKALIFACSLKYFCFPCLCLYIL